MNRKRLETISTEWTEVEELLQEGPSALAGYLAVHYLDILHTEIKRYNSKIGELQAHEIAADVLFEFLKNNYCGLHRLDRNKGHLRGLFFKIIKRKLSLHNKKISKSQTNGLILNENPDEEQMDLWANIYLDVQCALAQLKIERPLLYESLWLHYFEGKKISEISEQLQEKVETIKSRLYSGRQWLAEALHAYKEN